MVLKDISMEVKQGESVGLLGPNGAGKTTAFYCITGQLSSTGGQIFLNSQDITHLPFYQRARLHIGYLPQENSVFRGLTVEQNIMAILEVVEPDKKKRKQKLDDLLDEFSITSLRKSPATSLSGGERRRVEIARALANDPKFILLDEPFAGIDPIAVNDIRGLVSQLKNRGLGVIITDHNVRETLGITDRSYVLHDGKILKHGTTTEIVKDEMVKKVYLGEDFVM
ncbi:MAG: LPS export ABC transporter ATP-binding protein [Alphaproteobacteria bacterium]|nr:LPS export ABC transporter ATP-binding protein [Alphaproteobacteria bacterium]MBN2675024.1 LPS export ABC transporter ATP-binding protein [Alphaproteobacteria bacterium]